MIEIPGIARPRPSPHLHTSLIAPIFKRLVATGVSKKRIPHAVFLIKSSKAGGSFLLKIVLHGNTPARGSPHVCNVEIFPAVVVVVEPADAHAGADVLDPSLHSDIRKSSVSIVAIKILSAKVVDHVEIGPAVAIVVSPCATKAVTRVVLVEP